MYVVFHVEFDGIVRNIHFRRDITMKFFKNHGTIFCPNSLQRRGRNNFAHITCATSVASLEFWLWELAPAGAAATVATVDSTAKIDL